MRCLEKDPGDRPESAEEVRRELKAMSDDRWTQAEAMAWWQEYARPKPDRALAS